MRGLDATTVPVQGSTDRAKPRQQGRHEMGGSCGVGEREVPEAFLFLWVQRRLKPLVGLLLHGSLGLGGVHRHQILRVHEQRMLT